jgi:hypothetical protein
VVAVLDQIKDDWEFVIDPDVRRRFYCQPVAERNDFAIVAV